MPRTRLDFVPSYRRHKSTGQGVVTLNGKDPYLGGYGTAASKANYDKLVAEWLASGRALPTASGQSLSEVALAYLRFAEDYYRGSADNAARRAAAGRGDAATVCRTPWNQALSFLWQALTIRLDRRGSKRRDDANAYRLPGEPTFDESPLREYLTRVHKDPVEETSAISSQIARARP
ncbi:MAG TPA: hypothetical protein VKE94_01480 [Gemmataceae bacterium]|nr:hypothetical protein [Gemmataceae bacterium]